jgi:elongation factor 1-beta
LLPGEYPRYRYYFIALFLLIFQYRSYVTGYALSEDDKKELKALTGIPSAATHPNVYRWAVHIVALTGIFVGQAAAAAPAPATAAAPAAAPAAPAAADDFDDMFGGDDDEDGETAAERAATKARKERMELARKLKEEKDAAEGKKKKAKEVEKSLVVLEVKPWEADTDLEAVWKEIIKYQQEGLTWGASFKLEPVAYGIKKLVLTCTIVDSLVVLDDITENIEAMEDYVQSVEIASMNKI